MLCGDIIKKTDDILIKNFLNSFAIKLNFPIFNAEAIMMSQIGKNIKIILEILIFF